ncbi:MAG: hypothetical protein KDC38_08895, partial [Planctomycetes bacterium]|nr:hypothetical protein [Planctomycetota bacterium]
KAYREVEAVEERPEVIAGRRYRVLRLTRPGVGEARLLIDSETSRVGRKRTAQPGTNGTSVRFEEVLDDYVQVDDLWLPRIRTISIDDVERQRITTSEFRVNPEVPAGTFER